jgi:hypothetical protein
MPSVAEFLPHPHHVKLFCIDGTGTKLSSVDLEIVRLSACLLRRANRHPEGRAAKQYLEFFGEMAWVAACIEPGIEPGVEPDPAVMARIQTRYAELYQRFVKG